MDHARTDDLVAAIEALLDDRARAEALGRAARETARARYDARWIHPAREQMLVDLLAG